MSSAKGGQVFDERERNSRPCPRSPSRKQSRNRRRRWALVAASLLAACGDSGAGPPANRAPEARGSVPAQALNVGGDAATVDVSDNFSDPDGDALTYAVSSSADSVAAASVSGSVVTVRPVAPGTARIAVSARDPGGLESAPLSFRATVTIGPDLAVSVSPDSITIAPGDSLQFTVTVANQGDADAAPTSLRLFESADAAITTSDSAIGEPADVPSLAPGEFARARVDATLDRSAPPGTVFLGACADAAEGEFNTANNCSNALTIVVRAADAGDAVPAEQFRSNGPVSAVGRLLRIDHLRFSVARQAIQ